jgi:hypothetical protein
MKRVLATTLALTLALFSVPDIQAQSQICDPCRVSKKAFDVVNATLDFSNRAKDGITLVSVTVTNLRTNADATSAIVSSTPAPTVILGANKVFVQFKSGSVGDRYNVSVRVTTNDTLESIEGNFVLQIVAGA